ncbi:MAG: hypothetical protein JWO02_1783 [Solirubrobacterales bacterium]|nr:hypothetical protein [Solirubrobacterales bacterium]
MSKQARKILVAMGAVAVAVAVVVFTGGDDGYTVKAELANAGGLRKNSSVKIAGVPAGKIKELEITGKDTAVATLQIDDGAAPIGTGAKLNVRPTDLLGERYAEIKGGDRSRPLPSGSMLPQKDTATPVELDDILNMLDVNTRQRLGILVNETGVALTGRGADFNKLLAQLPPSLKDTDKLLRQVAAENAAMKAGIRRADHLSGLVNARRGDLGDLISQASDALDVVAKKRVQLGGTIQNAPGALAELRRTLTNLDAASTQLRPAAADLQATAAPLKATLEALPAFANEARPALDKAKAVSPDLTRLARQARPTVRALEPTARRADQSLKESTPILKHLDRRGWDDLLFFVNNMNLGVRGRDGIGHFIGAKLNIATEYIDNAVENFTNVDLSPKQAPAKKRKPTDVAPVKPLLDKVTKQATGPVEKIKDATKNLLPSVTGQVGKAVDDALGGIPGLLDAITGKKQETKPPEGSDALRLFDYLMGQ